MSGIRQRLTEIADRHEAMEDYRGHCDCGWYEDGVSHGAHVADVLIDAFNFTRETDGDAHRWNTDWEADE